MEIDKQYAQADNTYFAVFIGVLFLAGLTLISRFNFLLFHTIVEASSIVTGFTIFAIAWNARKLLSNHFLLFLGIALLFVGVVDSLHALSYKGMGVFSGNDANTPTQLWIAGRYIQSISLLVAPAFITRKINTHYTFSVFFAATFLLLGSIFYYHNFPACFIDGVGLTTFKKVGEYVICFILLGAIWHLFLKRTLFDQAVFGLMVASITSTIVSELFFTFYISVYGLSNLIGHYFKILSVYCLYRAIVETGLTRPYRLLFKELKSSEQALRESEGKLERSEKRYRELYDKAPLPYQSLDKNGRVVEVNGTWLDMLGYSEEEVIGRSFGDFLLPEFREHFENNFPRFKEKGHVRGIEFEVIKKDGTVILASFNGRISYDEQGNFIQTHCIFKDITEQRKMENKLTISHQEWSAAMDASDDAIYLLDTNRHILRANKTFYLMTGSSPETAIGNHITNIVHPEDEVTPCPVCLAQEEKRDTVIIMEPDHPDNPAGQPIEVTVTIIKDGQEQALSILMRLHDLTSQRQIENDLRKSKEEWERTFNSIPDIVTLQDHDMRIVKINQVGCDTIGLSCDQINGQHCYELFRGEDGPCPHCPLLETKKDFQSYSREIHHEKLGKSFLVSAAPVMDENGKLEYIVHIAKDITEQKVLQRESDQRLQQVVQADKLTSLGEVVAGVAHEINNPNSFISYNVPLLKEIWQSLEPCIDRQAFSAQAQTKDGLTADECCQDMSDIIAAIKTGSERINTVVNNLKDFVRLDEDVNATSVQVNEVVEKAYTIVGAQVRKSGGEVEFQLADDLPQIMGYFQKLEQVVANLLINAGNAISENNNGRIRVSSRYIDVLKSVAVSFEDNGIGMTPDTVSRIFEPFYTTRRASGGTGLGLSVSYGLIDDHNGKIGVLSRPGIGTRFTLFLPVDPQNEKLELQPSILFVDQEEELVSLKIDFMVAKERSILTIDEPERVIRFLEEHPEVDIVLSTIKSPNINGWELLEQIKTRFPLLSVILLFESPDEVSGNHTACEPDCLLQGPFSTAQFDICIGSIQRMHLFE